MGNISDSSLAAGTGVTLRNTNFKASGDLVDRQALLLATPLAAKSTNVAYGVPTLVLSDADVGDRAGFGGMAQRLAKAFFRGSNYSIPLYVLFEEDASDAVAATGSLSIVVTTAVAGYIFLYIGKTLYKTTVTAGALATAIGDALVTKINADQECPVTAENNAGVVTFTARSKGPWGNGIVFAVNQDLSSGQTLPSGVTVSMTKMTGGSGLPAIAADLAKGLGSGSSANEAYFTEVIHGYMQEDEALDALAEYNGLGNEAVGLYANDVGRPFRSLVADVATGSAGLASLITLAGNRKTDRCNGVLARPGSLTHQNEIAAETIGYMALTNQPLAELNYIDGILTGVDSGAVARASGLDWTTDYTNRDTAIKSGISPTIVEDGVVKLLNVISFYRPASISVSSNAFREMCNISVIQNMLYIKRQAYQADKWTKFRIVSDKKFVTNSKSRARARDKNDVIDTELEIIGIYASHAWLYDTQYSVDALKDSSAVSIRSGGDGFITQVPYILSGVGNIKDNTMLIDTSIAAVSA